jgi:hypothetical protein
MNEPNRSPSQTSGGGTAAAVAESASEVRAEAGAQVKAVAQEASDHLRGLADRARSDVRQQAQARAGQAADGVRSFSSQLDALAAGDVGNAGPLAEYVRDASARASRLAGRLDQGPDAVLGDVRAFARRRPLVFLGVAGVLGFAAGRLLRSGASAASGDGSAQGDGQAALSPASPGFVTAPPPYPTEPMTAVPTGVVRP